MALNANQVYEFNHMNGTCFKNSLGTVLSTLETNAAPIEAVVTEGTIRSAVKIEPTVASAVTSITGHKLVAIGDQTGNTAYGLGDPTIATTGLMACFGRTAVATSTQTDTGADFRIINKLVNTAANVLQGAYVKCKNYAGATVGSLVGLFVECVADGTVTNGGIAVKIGSDGSTIKTAVDMQAVTCTNDAYITFPGGVTFGVGTKTPNWATGKGSIYIKTDGSDQKAMIYVCTVASGTWVLLNTVTA